MRTVAILFILITLHACETLEHTTEQCSPYFVFTDETHKLISAENSVCNCRQYKYSKDFLGPISGSHVDHPLEYCNKLVGNTPKNYTALTSFLEEIRREIVDHEGEHFVMEIDTHEQKD